MGLHLIRSGEDIAPSIPAPQDWVLVLEREMDVSKPNIFWISDNDSYALNYGCCGDQYTLAPNADGLRCTWRGSVGKHSWTLSRSSSLIS